MLMEYNDHSTDTQIQMQNMAVSVVFPSRYDARRMHRNRVATKLLQEHFESRVSRTQGFCCCCC